MSRPDGHRANHRARAANHKPVLPRALQDGYVGEFEYTSWWPWNQFATVRLPGTDFTMKRPDHGWFAERTDPNKG